MLFKKVTAASFFSGVGVMDFSAVAAFEGALSIQYLCEIDNFKRSILEKHRRYWPDAEMLKDIRDVEAIRKVDLIYGGFPCRDISTAGSKRGLEGKRSGLWAELSRIIRVSRPRYVVLENVSNINVLGGTTVTAELAEMGYDATWITVPAFAYGSPQYRFRWIFLGYSDCDRYERPAGWQIHSPQIGANCAEKSVSQCYEVKPARKGCSVGGWRKNRRAGAKSAMGRNAARDAARMVRSHKWPAGSWQRQKAHEPSRLAPPSATWASELSCIGDAALPQQTYPVFRALARVTAHGL